MNKLYNALRIILFLSFFLPFIKSCEIGGKKAETLHTDSMAVVDTSYSVDTLSKQHSEFNSDTVELKNDTLVAATAEAEKGSPILHFIFNSIIMPHYTKDVSLTGFGLFYFTVMSIFQKGFKDLEFTVLILPLTFIVCLIHTFIRTNRRNTRTLLLLNIFILSGLLMSLFLFGIEELLFGFWTSFLLALVTLLLIGKIIKDYAANTGS